MKKRGKVPKRVEEKRKSALKLRKIERNQGKVEENQEEKSTFSAFRFIIVKFSAQFN